jgi:repressor LexA
MTTGQRMKMRRKEIGLSAERVAEILGISPATVYRYEKGDIEKVPGDLLQPIAQALQTTPAYLMGWNPSGSSLPSNVIPLPQMREWKVLGATACGKPLHRELLDETVMAPDDIKADVVFRCVGDSMINARIFDGDAVFVRLQPEVENGQIAVVRVDDEYTLKRVYLHEDYVELRPENPVHKAIILRGHQLEPEYFEVVGLAAAFMSSLV